MTNITGSPDISILAVQAVFDLSGPLPVITLTNLSQGPNLQNVTYWFVVTSPSGTLIHEGTLATPDAIGAWTTFSITDPWPMPFGQIEWSGAPYALSVYITDSTGAQYVDSSYNASICRPAGCTEKSKNYFGVSWTNVEAQCQQGFLFFQDYTNASYKGIAGTRLSSVLRLVYPIDDTGNIPPPFVLNNFTVASAPISYSSSNYQFQTQVVYQYNLSLNVYVNIRYQSKDPKSGYAYITFPVWCNIDLMPLICEFQRLIDDIERGTCGDVDAANQKLLLINPKMQLVVMGIMQPLTGIDVPKEIEDIQRIGGFHCDCFNAPTGIIPSGSSTIGGYTFEIVPQGGDIQGSVNVQGNTIQILLADRSYVFALASNITTSAFTITPSVNGYVKTYTLNINMTQFATDLLTLIPTVPSLVNLWNLIGGSGGSNLQLNVDGKCIFTNTSTYNYGFTLTNIPSNTTNALITAINIGGTVKNLSFAFNLTNLPALQGYLNSLGIGVFAVTNPSGQNVLITSNGNAANLSALSYSISGTSYVANQTTASAGYLPISANQVVQNIINYLCGITDAQMVTSAAYTITYASSSGVETVIVPAGTSLTNFLTTLTTLLDQTVENIGSSVQISCTTIQNAFPVSENAIEATDYILMTKGGVCAQGGLMDVFIYMLTASANNQNAQTAFCALVEQCGAGLACAPYNFFDVMVTTYNSACAPIVGIIYTLS
jgi:hypothetical protein